MASPFAEQGAVTLLGLALSEWQRTRTHAGLSEYTRGQVVNPMEGFQAEKVLCVQTVYRKAPGSPVGWLTGSQGQAVGLDVWAGPRR